MCLLAKLPTINSLSNIADTFWIHTPYRIRGLGVKSEIKKWGFENQNLKIQIDKTHPFLLVYNLYITELLGACDFVFIAYMQKI